jgi:hypothetical protein
MTARTQSPARAGRQSSASAGARQSAPRPQPAAGPGRLTKVSAKLNTEISRKAEGRPKTAKPRTRQDKKGLVLYVDPAVTVALRRLSLDTGVSVQALGMAALNLLFQQHDRPTFPQDMEEGRPMSQR